MDMNNENREKSHSDPPWTEDEVALLKKHYRMYTAAEIQQHFLPGCSRSDIYGKAKSLKLQKWPLQRARAHWTEEDVAILCEIYPEEGLPGACQRLPQHTRNSVRTKVNYLELRLSTPVGKYWSKEDRQRLIENLHLPIGDLRELFPQYSPSSITQVRRRLRAKNAGVWCQEELAILKAQYGHLGISMLQRRFFPMRLQTNIRQQVDELKHPLPSPELNGWSEEECDILFQHYPTVGAGEIQQRYLPHRTRKGIKEKARQLGVLKYGIWTLEELQILKDVYPWGAARAVQAMLPHRSCNSIHGKVRKLGLSRRRWPSCPSRAVPGWKRC